MICPFGSAVRDRDVIRIVGVVRLAGLSDQVDIDEVAGNDTAQEGCQNGGYKRAEVHRRSSYSADDPKSRTFRMA